MRGCIVGMEGDGKFKCSIVKFEWKRPVKRTKCRWQSNNKMHVKSTQNCAEDNRNRAVVRTTGTGLLWGKQEQDCAEDNRNRTVLRTTGTGLCWGQQKQALFFLFTAVFLKILFKALEVLFNPFTYFEAPYAGTPLANTCLSLTSASSYQFQLLLLSLVMLIKRFRILTAPFHSKLMCLKNSKLAYEQHMAGIFHLKKNYT